MLQSLEKGALSRDLPSWVHPGLRQFYETFFEIHAANLSLQQYIEIKRLIADNVPNIESWDIDTKDHLKRHKKIYQLQITGIEEPVYVLATRANRFITTMKPTDSLKGRFIVNSLKNGDQATLVIRVEDKEQDAVPEAEKRDLLKVIEGVVRINEKNQLYIGHTRVRHQTIVRMTSLRRPFHAIEKPL